MKKIILVMLITFTALLADFVMMKDGTLTKIGVEETAPTTPVGDGNIPILNIKKRSDWIDVTALGAMGNGTNDDTAAIQAALNLLKTDSTKSSVYFPAGTYKITDTLVLGGNLNGISLKGHGRNTILKWGSSATKPMLRSDGSTYAKYVGLVWDGNNVASIGFYHHSKTVYETTILHKHEVFKNFTEAGIKAYGGLGSGYLAVAETLIQNCLFENNRDGIIIGSDLPNALDWIIDHSEFRNNTIGVNSPYGSAVIYNSHFENSSDTDIYFLRGDIGMRNISSKNSNMFFRTRPDYTDQYMKASFQNCHIDSWTRADGIAIEYGYRGNGLLFDCSFTNPPNPSASPIKMFIYPNSTWVQSMALSNNKFDGTASLINSHTNARILNISTKTGGSKLSSGSESFLSSTTITEGEVIDITDKNKITNPAISFDSTHDDAPSLREAIALADKKNAIVYIPKGNYSIHEPIDVKGSNYAIEGSGIASILDGAPTFIVGNASDILIKDINFNNSNKFPIIHNSGSNIKYKRNLTRPDSMKNLFNITNNADTITFDFNKGALQIDNNNGDIHGNVVQGPLDVINNNGYIGIKWLNVGYRDADLLKIQNNSTVTIGDFYTEQSERLFLFSGNGSTNTGIITFGHIIKMESKTASTDEYITINNYKGKINLLQGWLKKKYLNLTREVKITQTSNSTNNVDLVMLGTLFDNAYNLSGKPVYRADIYHGTSTLLNATVRQDTDGNNYDIANPSPESISHASIQLEGALDKMRTLFYK